MSYQNYPEIDSSYFSVMKPEEEHIQPVPFDASHEWTETSMFGFNIPEHDIDCIIYHWHHPALRVTSGGIMIWRGKNSNQVECEYSDYRLVMPMPGDHTDCTYANGITVKMLRALEEFHISFEDATRNTSLDLRLTAIMPPACRHNGGHITQAMKTSGELVLNGTAYRINGFHTRDRSWNEHRSEAILKLPPLNWTVGIVDETFAFHHLSFDRPSHRSAFHGKLPDTQQSCLWGYVFEDGVTYGVLNSNQNTVYDPLTLFPLHIETTLQATNGKFYRISGVANATTQIQCWPNMTGLFALIRWEVEGKGVGYGDVQRCLWHDAYRLMSGKEEKQTSF